MTDSLKFLVIGGIALLALIAYILGLRQPMAFGSAPSGLPATVATSSVNTFAALGVNSLFATSSCAARVVTTQGGYLELTFSDYAGQSPSATFGHYQAASTTVQYDSGLYGCGLFKGYSNVAQVVTVTETR